MCGVDHSPGGENSASGFGSWLKYVALLNSLPLHRKRQRQSIMALHMQHILKPIVLMESGKKLISS